MRNNGRQVVVLPAVHANNPTAKEPEAEGSHLHNIVRPCLKTTKMQFDIQPNFI